MLDALMMCCLYHGLRQTLMAEVLKQAYLKKQFQDVLTHFSDDHLEAGFHKGCCPNSLL